MGYIVGSTIEFVIDYSKDSDPKNVFSAAASIVSAFENMDMALSKSIGNIQTKLVIESIESGSLKSKVRSLVEILDDNDLRQGDFKRIIGSVLLESKYAVLRWANESDNMASPKKIINLANDIQEIAETSELRSLGDYSPPPIELLADSVKDLSTANKLIGKDVITVNSDMGEEEISTELTWDSSEVYLIFDSKASLLTSPGKEALVVKKPDFLGKSKWRMLYKGKSYSFKIDDLEWLKKFQSGNTEAIAPGDSLEVDIRVNRKTSETGEILSEDFIVTKVHKIHHKKQQPKLL